MYAVSAIDVMMPGSANAAIVASSLGARTSRPQPSSVPLGGHSSRPGETPDRRGRGAGAGGGGRPAPTPHNREPDGGGDAESAEEAGGVDVEMSEHDPENGA